MRFWRPRESEPETTRGELILARKPARGDGPAGEGRTAARGGLLEVVIPRHEPRRSHERGEERRVLRDVAALVTSGGRTFASPLANISSNGVMIDCDHPLSIGEEVAVEIENCEAIPMTVRWIRGGRVGLEFLAETTIVADAGVQDFVIEVIRRQEAAAGRPTSSGRVGAENRVGGPRLALMWLCELTLASGSVAARIRNISVAGALVSFDEPASPSVGERASLAMGEDFAVDARIQWLGDELAGVAFDQPFPLAALVERPCARIVEPQGPAPSPRYASREEAMRIEYTGMTRPFDAPDMDYQPLTLRELYATLYGDKTPRR